jgi:hypothetical protein
MDTLNNRKTRMRAGSQSIVAHAVYNFGSDLTENTSPEFAVLYISAILVDSGVRKYSDTAFTPCSVSSIASCQL